MVSENKERLDEVPELKEDVKAGVDYENEYKVLGYGERLKGDYPYLDEAMKDAYPQDKDVKQSAPAIEPETNDDNSGFTLQ